MPKFNIFLALFASACVVGTFGVFYYWNYASKNHKYRVLYSFYALLLTYMTLMTTAFDFNKFSFDVQRLNSYIDLPTLMPQILFAFLLARFCFDASLVTAISKTIDNDTVTSFRWWHYVFSMVGLSFVFSCLLSVNTLAYGKSVRISIVMFLVGICPSLCLSLYLLPLPFIQKQKGNNLDSWE